MKKISHNSSGIDFSKPISCSMSGSNGWSLEDFLNMSEDEYNEALGVIKSECRHIWEEYTGFTDKYYFCTKCDKKQKEAPEDVHYIKQPWWA